MNTRSTTTQQTTAPPATPTWLWLLELIIPLISAILSIAWLFRDWDYEPALAVTASVIVFFIILISKGGKQGIFFAFGIVSGAVCAYLLLFVVPQFGFAGVKTEPVKSQVEKETLDNKVKQLQEQITQLESIKSSSETEINLRKQIAELETELTKLRNQPQDTVNTLTSNPNSEPPGSTDSAPEKVIKSQTVNEVLYEVISVKPSGSQLEVILYVTNKGPDRNLDIWTESSITDDKGNLYKFAGATNAPTLFSHIRNKVSIRFNGGAQSKSLQLLNIRTEKSTIHFRDLPVTN